MRVAVYLAAVPAKTKNQSKRQFLSWFAAGVAAAGDPVVMIDDVNETTEADVAVLQGWIGMKSTPHLELRRRVIERQRAQGRHVLVIDSNLFGFLDLNDRDRYLRYSLDGIFPTTGYYFDRNVDPSRWAEIKRNYGFVERDWNTSGRHILICLQRQGGWSMDGTSVIDWLAHILSQIDSTRLVVLRPHPGSLKVIPEIRTRWPGLTISQTVDLRDDLDQAWCTITYNSSPAVASLLWGVPTFVTDPDPRRSQAWPEANTDLRCVDDPERPDRRDFYHRLSQCHFATADLASGSAWRFMRDRLP